MIEGPEGGTSHVKLGTIGLFPLAMMKLLGYGRADGATWENSPQKILRRTLDFDPERRPFTMYDLNLEQEMLPVGDRTTDPALCRP